MYFLYSFLGGKMRRKHPKLPNGYGSIKKLSGKRRNPYAVYPPSKGLDEKGNPIMEPAICYTDDWYKGFAVLTAYKAGTYVKGMEVDLDISSGDAHSLSKLTTQMMQTYSQLTQNISGKASSKTFAEVYELFYKDKFEGVNSKKYSQSSISSTRVAYKNCAVLHNKPFDSLVTADLQNVIDTTKLKHSSLELIVSLYHQMYSYAIANNICQTDYSAFVKIKIEDDDEHGVPFTDDDLKILWKHTDDEIVRITLIMCYSGHRISELKIIDVDIENKAFTGGVKTKSSKSRVVPIHSAILPLVETQLKKGKLLPYSTTNYRKLLYAKLEELHIEKHTPHDCRHTFTSQATKYNVNPYDIKRMLGHAFQDVTNSVYVHRDVEDLRIEIEKIKLPQ